MKKYLIALLLLLIPSFCYADPIIYFSDMTDGPITGFNQSATQGAAITIWGTGFGSSGTLSVGGQTLSSGNSAQVAEWGTTTNPTTARGLQRITFYLNSSMATGGSAPNTAIQVTVGGVSSNTVPFHCRTLGSNHIYFLSTSGNDSANGYTTSTPWKTGMKLRTSLVAGDIAYLRAGTYTDVDSGYSSMHGAWIDIWPGNFTIASGTAYNSIGIIAYPLETPQIGDGDPNLSSNYKPECMFNRFGSGSGVVNYLTVSKMTVRVVAGVWTDNTGASVPWGDSNLRFIGNDIQTTGTWSATGVAFAKEGGTQSSTYFYMLGNYFHNIGVPLAPTVAPTLMTGTGTGLTGQYNAKYTYVTYRSAGQVGQESLMSSAGTPVTLSNGALRVTWSQPSNNRQNSDSASGQYMHFAYVRIYRTLAGGSTYYFDSEVAIANGYADLTTADATLTSRADPRYASINGAPPASFTNTTIQGGYYVEGIYLGGYGHSNYVYVNYNEFDHVNGNAIQFYGHMGNTDYIDNAYFVGNYVHHLPTCAWNNRAMVIPNGGDSGGYNYSLPYMRNFYMYNNVLAYGYGPSIRIDGGASSAGGGNAQIYNNTIYYPAGYADAAGQGMGIAGSDPGQGYLATTVDFKNNILYFAPTTPSATEYNSPFYGGPQNSVVGLSESYNLFYGLGANHGLVQPGTTGTEAHPWTGSPTGDVYNTDPLFVNATPVTYSDFPIQSTSPAKNAGIAVSGNTTDFYLTPRPQGGVYDIGAFEYQSGSTTYYTVLTNPGTGCSISPSSQSIASGSVGTFTISATTGYTLTGESGCSGSFSAPTYTTGAITGVCTVTCTAQYNTASSSNIKGFLGCKGCTVK